MNVAPAPNGEEEALPSGDGVEGFLVSCLQKWGDLEKHHGHPVLTGLHIGLVASFGFPEYARMILGAFESGQVDPTNEELEHTLLAFIEANPIQAIVIENKKS